MAEARVGIISGSGLFNIEEMTDMERVKLNTPFGKTSDVIVVGNLDGVKVAFLPRHGEGHRIGPSELPAKANIYALKYLGVERIISTSAVGSLKEEIEPLDIVIPDQLIDRTRGRSSTFFTNGIVAHVAFAEPFCPLLSQILFEVSKKVGAKVHKGGTYLVIEGPQFSTRAESQLYRLWGADVIGMTALPEAKLAREAEICYATLAFVTDYDCWRPTYEWVTTDMIWANIHKSIDMVKRILKLLISSIPQIRDCVCANALKDAVVTETKYIDKEKRKELELIIGKYLSEERDVSRA